MKKTAVQEVIDHIETSTKIKFKDTSKDLFNDMHKFQITEAIEHVLAGFITNESLRYKIAEKYYNEVYGNNRNNEE
jgi:hypothetical protein